LTIGRLVVSPVPILVIKIPNTCIHSTFQTFEILIPQNQFLGLSTEPRPLALPGENNAMNMKLDTTTTITIIIEVGESNA
jgi:hypothetical protein